MTHLSRPRLWIAALLAALSLYVFVTLRVRYSDAQDNPAGETTLDQPATSGRSTVSNSAVVQKGSKKSQTQRKSSIMVNGFVVVLPKEVIDSQDITVGDDENQIVAIGRSRNRDVLFGYSPRLGKWVKQPTDIPKTNSVPLLGETVAIVRLDSADKPDKLTYFIFNLENDRWSSIVVSADASAPTIHKNKIVITDGDTTHVFNGLTGEWSSPTAEVADNETRKPGDVGSPRGAQGTGGVGGGFGGSIGGGVHQSSQSTIEFADDVVALPKEAIGSQQIVVGGNLAIIVSSKHDMLWGYSKPLGKWFKQPVSLDGAGLIPIVGGAVAAVAPVYKTKPEKKTYFAFSAATGRWSSIDVSLNASEPSVHATMVVVTDGETTHVFKNDTGKWSTPTETVAEDERSSAPKPSPMSKHPTAPTAEFADRPPYSYAPPYLRYAPDQDVYLVDMDADGVLDVVPADEMKSSRPGEDHSIVGAWQMVRETTAKRREVAEEQVALQESLGPQHPALAKINARLAELEAEERDWIARLKAFAAPASFGRVTVSDWQSRLKSELQQAEQEAEQAARAVKAPKNSRDKDQAQTRLRESVGKAFASRQKLQQLEAELLRERLRQVDDRLQERGRLRDRIIQRRVEELSNSNLDWDATRTTAPGTARRTFGEPTEQVSDKSSSTPISDRTPEPSSNADGEPGGLRIEAKTVFVARSPAEPEPKDNRYLSLTLRIYELADVDFLNTSNDTNRSPFENPHQTRFLQTKEFTTQELEQLRSRWNPLRESAQGIRLGSLPQSPESRIVVPIEQQLPVAVMGEKRRDHFGFECVAEMFELRGDRIRFVARFGKPQNIIDQGEHNPLQIKQPSLVTELLLKPNEPVVIGPIGEINPRIAVITVEIVGEGPFQKLMQPTDASPHTIAIVNGERLTYRDLLRVGASLDNVTPAINEILLRQAAEKAGIKITAEEVDAEIEKRAKHFNLSIDDWYKLLQQDRGISRERYRDTVIWPELALKRLAGDDIEQYPKYLTALRSAAKVEILDRDAKELPMTRDESSPKFRTPDDVPPNSPKADGDSPAP